MYRKLKVAYAHIEVTPPAGDDKTIDATELLFSALHGLGSSRSLKEKLLVIHHTFSAEITSTKATGIRYIIGVPEHLVGIATKLIQSYLPDSKLKTIKHTNAPQKVHYFKLNSHYAYPIKQHSQLEDNDPIGYITGALSNLETDEQISYKLTLTPRKVRSAKRISKKLLRNDHYVPTSQLNSMVMASASGLSRLLFGITDSIGSVYHGESNYSTNQKAQEYSYKTQVTKELKPVRQLSQFEQELAANTHDKLKRPLYKASISIGITARNPKDYKKSIATALSLYSVPGKQHIKPIRTLHNLAKFTHVRNLHLSPSYLGAKELASLYHFPHSVGGKTDNVVQSLSKTLPAPISLKNGSKLDVLIGVNKHHGVITPIGLTAAERERHMYIIGGTGNGKTTMIKYQIIQDIRAGKGVAVIDPHGDLAEELLGYIPNNRHKDVVYINPLDLDKPVGINLLELQPGPDGQPKTGNDLILEKDMVTESAMSVLRKVFSEDDSGGHRIEYVLRNTIQTALTLPEANLFTIFRLLNDPRFRTKTIKSMDDKVYQDLKNFWKQELGKAGDMQRVKMAAGITAKIGRFLFSGTARAMLEQNKSTIDFSDIMDSKKIVICNFSKGLLGEDTSALFGITILAKLQLASLRRATQAESDRTSYYLYVDEFQNFATPGFVQMLSEARKYKLFLTMAEQSTQQQDDQQLVEKILANVGTVVAFRSGSPKDEQFIQPLFAPYVAVGELSNLPAYSFYTRISAITPQEPMSGETVLMDNKPDAEMAIKVQKVSRRRYGHAAANTARHTAIKDAATTGISMSKKNKENTTNYTIVPTTEVTQ